MEGGKPKNPRGNLVEQGKNQQQTQPTLWHWWEANTPTSAQMPLISDKLIKTILQNKYFGEEWVQYKKDGSWLQFSKVDFVTGHQKNQFVSVVNFESFSHYFAQFLAKMSLHSALVVYLLPLSYRYFDPEHSLFIIQALVWN